MCVPLLSRWFGFLRRSKNTKENNRPKKMLELQCECEIISTYRSNNFDIDVNLNSYIHINSYYNIHEAKRCALWRACTVSSEFSPSTINVVIWGKSKHMCCVWMWSSTSWWWWKKENTTENKTIWAFDIVAILWNTMCVEVVRTLQRFKHCVPWCMEHGVGFSSVVKWK